MNTKKRGGANGSMQEWGGELGEVTIIAEGRRGKWMLGGRGSVKVGEGEQ